MSFFDSVSNIFSWIKLKMCNWQKRLNFAYYLKMEERWIKQGHEKKFVLIVDCLKKGFFKTRKSAEEYFYSQINKGTPLVHQVIRESDRKNFYKNSRSTPLKTNRRLVVSRLFLFIFLDSGSGSGMTTGRDIFKID